MNEIRMETMWLTAASAVLGLYLLIYPDIRIMPEMESLALTVELSSGYMAQDQMVNELMRPLEQKISHLDNVDTVESRTGLLPA